MSIEIENANKEDEKPTGRTPMERSKWSQPQDFVYACLGLSLRLDIFLISWHVLIHVGFSVIVAYVITWAFCIVPLLILQSYLGQFSSSGFINAFRISPIFKVMGYVSLAINLAMLSYYSIFAAIPVLYLLNSFRYNLPWSCEAFAKWWYHFPESRYNICNVISPESGQWFTAALNETKFISYRVPSVLFFRSYFDDANIFISSKNYFIISWELLGCAILVWFLLAMLIYMNSEAEKLGKLLRYLIWSTLILLLVCLARFLFLPNVFNSLSNYFNFKWTNIYLGFLSTPMYIMATLGPGWGVIVSAASGNKFKTNFTRYTRFIGLGQLGIFLTLSFLVYILDTYLAGLISHVQVPNYIVFTQAEMPLYLASGSAIAGMAWPNLWSILFYSMLILAAVIVMLIQIHSILVSLYDAFEFLHSNESRVNLGLFSIVGIGSVYFCSSEGILHFATFSVSAFFTQCVFNLLLILLVLWIYGRVRFQRDMLIMLTEPFATWKVYIIRIITPLILCVILCWLVVLGYFEHVFTSVAAYVNVICLTALPGLIIIGYMIRHIWTQEGSVKERLLKSFQANDWRPAEEENRQEFEKSNEEDQTKVTV